MILFGCPHFHHFSPSPQKSNETKDSAIVAVAFSNSGYHLAVATESVVQVRDIRKSKILWTLEGEDITSVAFDTTGKYLAYGGGKGVTILTTKEGTSVCTVGAKTNVSNIVWTTSGQLVTSGDADRQVRFYEMQEDVEMKE